MKAIILLSGGIDSPVAMALALEKGIDLIACHFVNYPFADDRDQKKVLQLTELFSKRFKKKIKLYFIPHGPSLAEFARKCERKIGCVLCRRMMLRVANKIAVKENASAIITGESLGQVASQTLDNLKAEFEASSLPLIRPLIGLNKQEIENLAKKFNTYDISIQPSICCHATPEKPATKSRLEKILLEEKNLDLDALVDAAIQKTEAKVIQ
jgi:thiamine biosynthesis protein ThiI